MKIADLKKTIKGFSSDDNKRFWNEVLEMGLQSNLRVIYTDEIVGENSKKERYNFAVVIFEEKPRVRFVFFDDKNEEDILALSMPYIYYMVTNFINYTNEVARIDLFVYCRNKSYRKGSDFYRLDLLLTGLGSDGWVCTGESCFYDPKVKNPTIREKINRFWFTTFGLRYSTNTKHIKRILFWAEASETDPEFALKAKYSKFGNLEHIISLQKDFFKINK